jgi:single-strand DNA-binding protein
VVVFGRQAEIAQQYLRKGSEAYIEGRLRTRKYTGKDGIERYSTEVVCESLQLGARPTGSAGSSDASDEFESPQRAPRAAAPTAPAPKPQQPSAPDVDSSFDGDDIPF